MDLSMFTPEQIAALRAQLNADDAAEGGRSPFRPRQLHDLRLLPTKDDPRPTFFWSAEPPRNAAPARPKPFPSVRWHAETGQERTFRTAADFEKAGGAQVWADVPPDQTPLTLEERVAQQLAELSEEDRQLVLESQRQSRLARINADLAALTDAASARVLGDEKVAKKRGRKAEVA